MLVMNNINLQKLSKNAQFTVKTGYTKSEIARLCGVTKAYVQLWFKDEVYEVPPKFCPILELKTQIPCETWNPKVFTKEWSDLRNGR